VVEVLRLHLLLVRLPVVEVVEVGDDDRHWESDGQHTGNRAQRAHDLAPDSHGPVTWSSGRGEEDQCQHHSKQQSVDDKLFTVTTESGSGNRKPEGIRICFN